MRFEAHTNGTELQPGSAFSLRFIPQWADEEFRPPCVGTALFVIAPDGSWAKTSVSLAREGELGFRAPDGRRWRAQPSPMQPIAAPYAWPVAWVVRSSY